MSEQAQGPGWWIASDGRWYPPEQHPNYRPPPPPPPAPPALQGDRYPPPASAARGQPNALAIVALVAGIGGVAIGLGPAINWSIALAGGACAVVLGLMARKRSKQDPSVGGRGLAVAGFWLGILALILAIAGASTVNDAVNDLEDLSEELSDLSP